MECLLRYQVKTNFCTLHDSKLKSYCTKKDCGALLCEICMKTHTCPKKKIEIINDFLLDNYEFIKFIGQGSFGGVFQVKNMWTGEVCAIKVITNIEENELQIIGRELKLMFSLHHENFARLSNCIYNRSLKLLCIEMEYCENSLDLILPNLDNKTAKCYFSQICQGVHFLQMKHAFLELSLKPENILVKGSKIKICDLLGDITEMEESKDLSKKFHHHQMRNWEYWAPEIFELRKNKIERWPIKAEIWALGILFHKLLCQDIHPFLGKVKKSSPEEIYQILVSKEPKIENSVKDIKWITIIKKCLEKKPEKRPDLCGLLEMLIEDREDIKNGPKDIMEEEKEKSKSAIIQSLNQTLSLQVKYKEKMTLTGHSKCVNVLCLSCDNTKLLSGSRDNSAILWDLSKGIKIHTFLLPSQVWGLCFSKNKEGPSSVFIGTSENGIYEWDASSGKLIRNFAVNFGENLLSLDISPDGAKLVSGMNKGKVVIWDVHSGKAIKPLEGNSAWVNSVFYHPNGTKVASGSGDKTIKVWETSTGALLKTFSGHLSYVFSVNFSPDGDKIASGSHDQTAKIWDLSSGKILRSLAVLSIVCSVCFYPDGKKVITGDYDKTIKIWEISSGQLLETLKHQSTWNYFNGVCSLAIFQDGSHIMSGSGDNTVKIWEKILVEK